MKKKQLIVKVKRFKSGSYSIELNKDIETSKELNLFIRKLKGKK